MRKYIKILRYDKTQKQSYWQTFLYESENEEVTVAKALEDLNQKAELKDTEDNPAKPIRWECSCLQGKCGACAMLINGMPQLACDTKLSADAAWKSALVFIREMNLPGQRPWRLWQD